MPYIGRLAPSPTGLLHLGHARTFWVAYERARAAQGDHGGRHAGGDAPAYLAAVLNAFRGLGYFSVLATNFNNQAGINADTLSAVVVPWPDEAVGVMVATELDRRRTEANCLRHEARAGWEAARARFEDALLGPAA